MPTNYILFISFSVIRCSRRPQLNTNDVISLTWNNGDVMPLAADQFITQDGCPSITHHQLVFSLSFSLHAAKLAAEQNEITKLR